jgi:ABC-type glycerol-3-phosphate transport system permease component
MQGVATVDTHQIAGSRAVQIRRLAGRAALYLFVVATALMYTVPFLWMLRTSLLTADQVFADPPVWIPLNPAWSNYIALFEMEPFAFWLRNSLITTLIGVLGNTITGYIVAFGFARTSFPGRDKFFYLVLATMMIPFHITLIPQYLLFLNLRWLDTLLPLIVPSLFGKAFLIFILRQFLMTLPRELDEAAEMDGANLWQIMTLVILPQSGPAVATVAVFAFIDHWNEFLRPLVFIQHPENQTLAVGVRWFLTRHGAEFHLLMASSVLVLAPIIIAFFVAQKQFVRGIALTGIKG